MALIETRTGTAADSMNGRFAGIKMILWSGFYMCFWMLTRVLIWQVLTYAQRLTAPPCAPPATANLNAHQEDEVTNQDKHITADW